MSVLDRAVQRYVAAHEATGGDPGNAKVDAEFVLGMLTWPDYPGETVALGELLTGKEIGEIILDQEQALALAVAMVNAEIARPVDDETPEAMHAAVLARLHGAYPDAQAAAFAAVRQLGGARRVGIPAWMETALGDSDHWTACDHVLGTVELAVRNTAPGRRWVHVYRVGFVLFESA